MNNKNDFDFVLEHLHTLDDQITLPESLKADNLLKLIDNVEPEAASPDEGVQEHKIVHLFTPKRMAVAAMFLVALGFAILYKTSNFGAGMKQMNESAVADESAEYAADYSADTTEEKMAQSPELLRNEEKSSAAPANEFYAPSQDMAEAATEGIIEESAPAPNSTGTIWTVQGEQMIYGDDSIYTFPKGFIFSDSYSEGTLLIVNGLLAETKQSVITVFNQTERDDPPQFINSFVNHGKTLYTMVYSGTTIIISTEGNSTYVTSYAGAEEQSLCEIDGTAGSEDIFDSSSGFAIIASNSTVSIFDTAGVLMKKIDIDDDLVIENIVVEGIHAYLFLENGDTMTVPLTK